LNAGPKASAYPTAIDTSAKRALFDNTGQDESLALAIDAAIRAKIQDGWRDIRSRPDGCAGRSPPSWI